MEKASIEKLCHLDSRQRKAPHGELLLTIYELLKDLSADIAVFVRERAFSRFPHETQALFKVVGVADLAAWEQGQKSFYEIAPTTIKKLLTGSGKASKGEVADALERYIGKCEYASSDESDAVAAGVAWLLQNKLIGVENNVGS